jgi:hypothetical protein
MKRTLLCLAVTIAIGAPVVARADQPMAPLTFEIDKERTTRQKILIGSFGAGAALFTGIGVLFHLDAREKSDSISATGNHTGKTYTAEVDDVRSDALRSRAFAIAAYGVGGALLVTTFVVYLVTNPGGHSSSGPQK